MKYKIILKIFNIVLFLILILNTVSATTLTSSGVSQLKMFKCSPTTIYANFSDNVPTTVTAILSGQAIMERGFYIYPSDSVIMSQVASGQWQGTYGNDATLKWGLKTISFIDNGSNIYISSSSVFVYSDTCVGTGVTNYTGISSGLGRYTKMLYNGQFTILGTSLETSFIGWALFPWVEYFGYIFYLLVIFTVCTTIYLKTQNITQPLAVGIFLLLFFAPMAVVPVIYRQYIIFVLAICITALYFKLFVRD